MPVIHCVGLNHRTADVALRERLAFSEEDIRAALARLGCGTNGSRPTDIAEMVILSTCNRTEIYAVAPREAFPVLEGFIADAKGMPLEEFQHALYRYRDEEAVHHLFRVAAGLDSLVLGEPQILGQVTRAWELARGQGTVRAVLGRLFQAAVHTGKRARTETGIGHNPASVASVAVHLAAKTVGDLSKARVLVLGAGEMAEQAVEALRRRGASRIRVMNRTLSKAEGLASRWGGEATTFEHLVPSLAWADIVIASTGAPHTLVHRRHVQEAMRARPERPLVILDIALPRDVDADVAEVDGVQLYDLDALEHHLHDALAARQAAVPQVEAIIAEEVEAFMAYLRTLEVAPLIRDLRAQAEEIRQAELEKTLRKMPHLSEEDQAKLDALTRAIVNKLLHSPTVELKEAAQGPRAAETAAVARRLFGISTN
ncbi:MAG: glutamyl-tRNA reductase [Chloroflexi bacterium]|nr:glutamyl-tRNA reductase [Chloroflexota bacterium]